MGKKIAVINDLSGFGKCSLTAAIPVISVMGVQACPLPTAILSAQTGYANYFCDDYTEQMDRFRTEWEKMKVDFDGIYTGFVSSENQILNIFRFLDTFKKEDTFLLTDPVLGDNGKVHSLFNDKLLEYMKELVHRADIVTPNLTELCLLQNGDYGEISHIKDEKEMIREIQNMAGSLVKTGPSTVVVTGITMPDDESGIKRIGNLSVQNENSYLSVFPYIGESYSGTGDLFASVIAAGMAQGKRIEDSMNLAGKFIELSIRDSVENKIPRNDGVEFEKHLGMLINDL